jgi:hypothetical protein
MSIVEWVVLVVVVLGDRHCALRLGPVPRSTGRASAATLPADGRGVHRPRTGRRMRVWYDPGTGKREYRPEYHLFAWTTVPIV